MGAAADEMTRGAAATARVRRAVRGLHAGRAAARRMCVESLRPSVIATLLALGLAACGGEAAGDVAPAAFDATATDAGEAAGNGASGDAAATPASTAAGASDTTPPRAPLRTVDDAAIAADPATASPSSAADTDHDHDAHAGHAHATPPASAVDGSSAPAADATAAGGPRLRIDPPEVHLGEVYYGASITGSVTLHNAGDAELVIGNVKSTCGCTAAELAAEDKRLAPGASVELPITMTPKSSFTPLVKYVDISTNDAATPLTRLRVSTDVKTGVAVEPRNLVFQDLTIGDSKTVALTVDSGDGEPFAIRDVTASVDLYSVEFEADVENVTHRVLVTTGPVEQRINPATVITISTTHSKSPEVKVYANTIVAPLVHVASKHLRFGNVAPGESTSYRVQIADRRTGEPVESVEVEHTRYDDVPIEVERDPADATMWIFTLTAPPERRGELLTSALKLHTSIEAEGPIAVMFSARILPDDAAASSVDATGAAVDEGEDSD